MNLSDLVPRPPKPAPAPIPIPVAAGFETSQALCSTHNAWYPRFRQAGAHLNGLPWIGSCDKCSADAALLKQASEVMETRTEAIERRVQAKLAATEDERTARVNAKLAPIVEDERGRLEAQEHWQDTQRFLGEEQQAELAGILAELRAQQ